jgi:hypothetical protein
MHAPKQILPSRMLQCGTSGACDLGNFPPDNAVAATIACQRTLLSKRTPTFFRPVMWIFEALIISLD